jgi:hypothetical protein
MTGQKMLQMVMPWTYRQGFTYPTKDHNIHPGNKKHKSLGNAGRAIKKAGQTMLRRALKRDMLNQLDEDNG